MTLETQAFSGCTGLTSITIPNSVTSIGWGVFWGCRNLTSITIPNSVTSIDEYAFQACSKLSSVTVEWDVPFSVPSNIFENVPLAQATLYVPVGAKASYMAASVWKNFGKFVENANITFADAKVKSICVNNWDTNRDRELSMAEAAAVTTMGSAIFSSNQQITSFNELQYFTGLTSIGNSLFNGCTSLTSVIIPSSVTSIGLQAFYNCTNLTSVTIPNSVTSIGLQAFMNCTNLTSVTFPNSVTIIARQAFQGCSGLTSLTIPSSVKAIGISAFGACSGLSSITVASGNTLYDSRNNCNAIIESESSSSNVLIAGCKNTIIPNDVTIIDDKAFFGITGLTSITIPNSVTRIGNYAFSGCSALTSVTVEWETPLSVPSNIFQEVPLDDAILRVPDGTKGLYQNAEVWNKFGTIVENENIDFADAKVKALCVENWDTNGDGELNMTEAAAVKDLGRVFSNNKGITSFDELKYFTGLTSIGYYAFYLSGLYSITIPSSVTSIGVYAFGGCSNLKTVTVEWDKPIAVNSNTFQNVPLAQATLYIPAGTSSAYKTANVWKNFGNIVENNNIDFADEYVKETCVFNWDTNGDGELSIIEAAAVTDLGDIFLGTEITSFDELQYFTGLTDIGPYAFSGCPLNSIIIPSNVMNIDDGAFENCKYLHDISIPANVAWIGERVFNGCYNLSWLEVNEENGTYDSRYNCHAIIETESNTLIEGCNTTIIPNSVTAIGDWAFSGRLVPSSLTIPNSVTSIGSHAFYDSDNFTSIVIPHSVTNIGEYAFASSIDAGGEQPPLPIEAGSSYQFNTSLTSVTVEWNEPLSVPSNIFHNLPLDQATLYVPAGTLFAYRVADVWKEFGKIVQYSDLVENGHMEVGQPEDWSYFWVHEWRSSESQYDGPANIVVDPLDPSNHCVKVVARSFDEALAAGNASMDGEDFANWDTQFFVYVKQPIKAGKRLRLSMRVRADKKAIAYTEAHDAPGYYNHWGIVGDIEFTQQWTPVVRDIVITPDMTQEFNGKEMHTIAFNLAVYQDGNVYYFDDIKLEMSPVDVEILPWGVDKPWVAKYVNNEEQVAEDANGNPWYAVNYDDSSWNTLTGPIERSNSDWFSQSFFDWETEFSSIYMRRTFTLDVIPEGDIIIKAIVDDNMQVYLNGVKIPCINSFENFNKLYIVPRSALKVGDNVLAMLATDEGGGEARCDYGMFVTDDLPYYVDEQGVVYHFEQMEGENSKRCVVFGLAMDHSTEIVIPDELFGTPVTVIREYAFDWSDLVSVTIPASVTEIRGNAFANNTNLTALIVKWEEPISVIETVFDGINYNNVTLYVPEGTKAAYKAADVWKEFFIDGDDRDAWFVWILLRELVENMETIGGYDLSSAKETIGNLEATKEDFENSIAQLQQQIKDRCANAAIDDLPVDATGLITNPSFTINNNDYWQGDTPEFYDYFKYRYFNNAEFYMTTFDFHQQLTGLPNGKYLLKVKGFHRPGSNEDAFSDYQHGTDNAKARLYANDESVTLVNHASAALEEQIDGWGYGVTSDGMTRYVPNTMGESSRWFANGYYENELFVIVTDGTLDLGVRLDESVDNGWVIFDDFRLYYQGEYNTWLVWKLLRELVENMETIGGYDLASAKETIGNLEATKEDFENSIAQLQQQIKDRCANAGTDDLPVDATGLITNPSFTINNNAYWQGDTPVFYDYFKNRYFNNAEFYMTTFDFHQQLTGLPNGNYLLKVKGFHRPGSNEDAFSDYQHGTDNAKAQLYANDESVTLVNHASAALEEQIDGWGFEVTSDGTTRYVPNTMGESSRWFANGYYENELLVTVTDGTLDLGIRLDESVDNGWVIFDDFRLYYQGAYNASSTITAQDVIMAAGGKTNLVLNLDNGEEKVSAFQFNITLPEGVTLEKNGGVIAYTLSSRCKGMTVNVVENQERCYTMMAYYSNYDKEIEGTSGPIVTFTLKADADLSGGTLEGQLNNIVLTNRDYEALKIAPVTIPITISPYPLGDVNHDNDVNIVDVLMTVDYILSKPVPGIYLENADIDGDGSIDISDVLGMVDIILHYVPKSAPALTTSDCLKASLTSQGMDLQLDNANRYTALEMTVEIPQGAALKHVSMSIPCDHHVETFALGGGLHRVVVYSLSGNPLPAGDALLHLDIQGRRDVKISNVVLANTFYEVFSPEVATSINNIDGESNDAPIYNIQGMKVTNTRKGVYIQNNQKKVMGK